MNLQKALDPRFQQRFVNSGAMNPLITLKAIASGAVRCPAPTCKGRFMRRAKGGKVRCKGCGLRANVAR